MIEPSVGSITSALLVVTFVGAANADATPEQRARLRDECLPIMGDPELKASEAYAATVLKTAEVMGKGWMPEGEWDSAIRSLLDSR